MYILIVFFFSFLFITNNLKIRYNGVRIDLIALFYFISIGVISVIINQANFIDHLYITFLRSAPILLLIFTFSFSNKVIGFKFSYVKRILLGYLIISLMVGLYQYFAQNRIIDDLYAIQGNAHPFSFLIIFISLFLVVRARSKKETIIFLLLHFISLFLAIKADFKLGLVAYLFSLIISYVIVYQRKYLKRFIIVGLICFVTLVVSIENIIPLLPFSYSIVLDMLTSEDVWDFQEVFPQDLELFKGYLQLFDGVFDKWYEYVFGVGPGNYATNVALAKEKPLAVNFVLEYRNRLNAEGIILGTLLKRFNFLINLLAEYGILGTIVYLTLLFKLLFYHLIKDRFIQKANNNIQRRSIWFLTVLSVFILAELPIFGTIEEGLYVSTFSLCYLLTVKELNRTKFKLVEIR